MGVGSKFIFLFFADSVLKTSDDLSSLSASLCISSTKRISLSESIRTPSDSKLRRRLAEFLADYPSPPSPPSSFKDTRELSASSPTLIPSISSPTSNSPPVSPLSTLCSPESFAKDASLDQAPSLSLKAESSFFRNFLDGGSSSSPTSSFSASSPSSPPSSPVSSFDQLKPKPQSIHHDKNME